MVSEYTIIVAMIGAILSIGLYAIVKGRDTTIIDANNTSLNPKIDNRYMLNETSIFPDYGTIISSGLEKNFEKINRDIFEPKVHEIALNATKWRDLFESTQEMIKGMKLIKIQEEELNAKHKNFNSTENLFDECKQKLLN